MSVEELKFLRSHHETAINLAVSFIRTTPSHACRDDLLRIIDHNRVEIEKLDAKIKQHQARQSDEVAL